MLEIVQYKILLKNKKQIWTNERGYYVFSQEDVIIIKSILLKSLYVFNAVLMRISMWVFRGRSMCKTILMCIAPEELRIKDKLENGLDIPGISRAEWKTTKHK